MRPLDRLNLLAVAILAAAAVAVSGRIEGEGYLLLRYGLMALGAVVLARRGGLLAEFYPVAFIPLVYDSLGALIPAVHPALYDAELRAIDRAIFGVDPTVWLERLVHPLLTDAMFLCYCTYYFLSIALAVALWRAERAVARRFFFTITLAYYVSYAGYFALPAVGPRFTIEHSVPLDATAIARAVAETLDHLERSKLDVFPSGHTMIAVAVLLVAWRRRRPAFWRLLPFASGLVASTVYCRYHYVIDLVAGTALAFLVVPVGDRLYDRAASVRSA